MGVVYRARDLSLGRNVAVKTLPRVATSTAARLRREAHAAANLSHPNLAMIFAAETWNGTPMLVFELLEGGTLRDRIRAGPLTIDDVLRYGVALCDGLATAHAAGILHRDIKPSNIGFSAGGVPKLLDFGLARFFDDAATEGSGKSPSDDGTEDSSTRSSGLVGTPAYLSPEAIAGEPLHADFDVWSLSLTLFEAMTGTNPFFDPSPTRTMNLVLRTRPPDVHELRNDCSDAVAAVLASALSHARNERPRTAAELRNRLAALLP